MTVAVVLSLLALSRIAGVPVECPHDWAPAAVRVTGSSDHAGYFDYRRRVIGLDPQVCWTLRQQPSIPEEVLLPSAYDVVGFAIFVFAHELQHARGVRDELQADCGAARTFDRVAARFGITIRYAHKLAAASMPLDGYDPPAITDCWPVVAVSRGSM